ncbi:MAG: hypothetical protein LBH06_07475 [Rikenellaceae bacterium]|nr:hypothetical protein [Rikenellaceae bacterium]
MIRLFTSGTHNGLSFSEADINRIVAMTREHGADRIPFVLGHPKNDLPVVGYLPKEGVALYRDGDKISIGFDRSSAEFSEESLDVLRQMGHNKISVRLEEGTIKHIGLVAKAAVRENNRQDFAEGLSGTYHTAEDFMEKEFGGLFKFFKTDKTQKNMEKEEKKETPAGDFAEISAAVKRNSEAIDRLTGMLAKQQEAAEQVGKAQDRVALQNDFAAAEFSHMTDTEKASAVDFCIGLTADQREQYKRSLSALNRKPDTPENGSKTADFGKKGSGDERSAEDIIREQVKEVI